MSAVLVGVKYKSDKRDQYLHHGGWLVKLGLWLLLCILPFFFPVGLVNAYCESIVLMPAWLLVPNIYIGPSSGCVVQHGWLVLALACSWWCK